MKQPQPNTLIKLTYSLSKEGFQILETIWGCEEKKTIYKLTKLDGEGKTITRHLNKTDLHTIMYEYNNSPSYISCSMTTTPEKLIEGKYLLKNKIIKTVQNFKSEIDRLISHI
ncbi:MAG: hypothetical protein AABY22_33185 [Nanoarchaeota archaeon]